MLDRSSLTLCFSCGSCCLLIKFLTQPKNPNSPFLFNKYYLIVNNFVFIDTLFKINNLLLCSKQNINKTMNNKRKNQIKEDIEFLYNSVKQNYPDCKKEKKEICNIYYNITKSIEAISNNLQ